MNASRLDVAQVDEVRLVLDRHRQDIQTLYELTTHTHTRRTTANMQLAVYGWLGSLVARASHSRLDGRELDSRPPRLRPRFHVKIKLF